MAEAINVGNTVEEERQLVTFYLGGEEFGIDIMNVKEIVRPPDMTKVPHSPPYVEGLANLRGMILPAVDGRLRLGFGDRTRDENTRMLVVDMQGVVTGIIVDRVSGVLSVTKSSVEEPPPIIRGVNADYIEAIVKLNGGKRIIMILNIKTVLDMSRSQTYVDDETLETVSASVNHEQSIESEEIEEELLVTFSLAGEEYAFNIMQVKEIIRAPEITEVPNVSHYIEGVTSIRNQLMPIISLRSFFNMPEADITDHSRVIVVDVGSMLAGFRVDRVQEVIRVPLKVIEPPPVFFDDDEVGQVKGITKLDNGNRLIMYLDAQRLLPEDALEGISAEGIEVGDKLNEDKELDGSAAIHEDQLVTFRLGKEEFAIQIDDIQEVNRMGAVTKVPEAPEFIDGLVNLRGDIIPALNLRRRFAMPERQYDDTTRIIITNVNNRKMGIVVDSVSEVLRIDRSIIQETPDSVAGRSSGKFISRVAKLNGGERMILILDLMRVMQFGSMLI